MTNIILIGMMGCGKTSVGRAVSLNASMPFFDIDSLIEAQQKMTIPHIFEQYGESYFRVLETEAAKSAATCNNAVISTGGGIVLKPENMSILKGFVIYLRCSVHQLFERTAGDSRPLLNAAKKERFKLLEELLTVREPLYTKYSNLILDTAPINELTEMILSEYSRYKRTQY